MKLIDMQCLHCGAHLKIDVENKQAVCEHCGANILIDDEVQYIQYDNAEEAGARHPQKKRKTSVYHEKKTKLLQSHKSQQLVFFG